MVLINRLFFVCCVLFFSSFNGSTVNKTVLIVVDECGAALPYVLIENSSFQGFTDENGMAILSSKQMEDGNTLVLTHMGYCPKQITPNKFGDTLRVQLESDVFYLPEDPIVSLNKKSKHTLSFKKEASMPFEPGDIFAMPIYLSQQQVEIKDFSIMTSGEWDSVEVKISVLDTTIFSQHAEKAKTFTVTKKRMKFKDLSMPASNERGRYLMVLEVVAIHGKSDKTFRIEGGETKEPNICYLKRPVHYDGSEDIYQVMWFETPVWQPKISVLYLHDKAK